MLENEKKLESIDRKDIFMSMLRDLPWDSLKDFIQANSQISKFCTMGGHRLEKKRRKRFEKIICREASKKNFESDICGGIFAQWYPVQGKLHKAIEGYFESEEYKTYREENGLDDDVYVLPDKEFEKLFDPSQVQNWMILLCFSPLKFSDEQADRILEAGKGGTEVLQKVEEMQVATQKEKQEKNRLLNENTDLRKRIKELSEEDKQIRTERKQLRTEREALRNKFETAQSENTKLKEKIGQLEKNQQQQNEKNVEKIKKEKARLLTELDEEKGIHRDWKEKYESQRRENRKLEADLKEAEKALAAERTSRMARDKEFRQIETFADAVLARIDWREVGRQMKLTPQLKRKFNSLMRSMQYEEDRSITLGGSLEAFWNKLQQQEKKLVEAVVESDTREVENGDVEAFWNGLTDDFQDVTIGLEARTILIQLLQETFYQTLSIEDLEKAKAPGTAKKVKKKV